MPMPPSWAMAIARRASVTVSIAADTSGRFRRMLRERLGGEAGVARQDLGERGHQQHIVEGERFAEKAHGKAPDAKGDYTDAGTSTGLARACASAPLACARTLRRRFSLTPARPCSSCPPLCVAALAAVLLASPRQAQWKWRTRAAGSSTATCRRPGHARGRHPRKPAPSPRTVAVHGLRRPAQRRAVRAAAGRLQRAGAAHASTPSWRRAASRPSRAGARRPRPRKSATPPRGPRTACGQARTCATLESGNRMSRTNDKGEHEFIDDKQRADEPARRATSIRTDCK